MLKNLPRSVLFLRNYRVVTCCFTKNNMPSQVFFSWFAIRSVILYDETRYSYKIDSSCDLSSTDKYDLRRHYSL